MPTIPRTVQVRRKLYAGDVLIVEAIKKVGPRNVTLLSRLTGLHPETVRYKIKKRFERAGFRIHADIAYDRLGLSLHWSTLRFQPSYEEQGSKILYRLGEVGHLIYYGKVIPQGHYKALFAVPAGKGSAYQEILSRLQGLGVIRDFTFEQATGWQNYSMNPKFFNFQSRRWEVDWKAVEGEESRVKRTEPKRVRPPDLQDLLVIKELQKDARQHFFTIAKNLHVNSKTMMYHVNRHVVAGGLIRGYEFRWMQDIEKSLAHYGLSTNVVVRGLSGGRAAAVRERFSKVPFIWEDYVMKNGDYSAWFFIPMHELEATYDYLQGSVSGLCCEPEVYTIKNHESCFFTIPYHTFADRWTAEADAVLGALFRPPRFKKIGSGKPAGLVRTNPGRSHQ